MCKMQGWPSFPTRLPPSLPLFPKVNTFLWNILGSRLGWIEITKGIPEGGRQLLSLGRKSIISQGFRQKLHGNERNWIGGGVPSALLDPPMESSDAFAKIKNADLWMASKCSHNTAHLKSRRCEWVLTHDRFLIFTSECDTWQPLGGQYGGKSPVSLIYITPSFLSFVTSIYSINAASLSTEYRGHSFPSKFSFFFKSFLRSTKGYLH